MLVVLILAVIVGAVATGLGVDYYRGLPVDAEARYVGRQACVDCHQEQATLFAGSHHDLAMGHATDESVLADFNDVTFEHHGIVSRMFRDGSRFMVHTEGPDGKMADFEIRYVFGVEPLQQYMVEFDRDESTPDDAIARLQVLRLSWDTYRKRWFYLEPPDVPEKLDPTDELHWTGITQRWNTMCAECHSTNLMKNYDPATQKYSTTFSEIDVSCEACHGPGSLHVQLAEARSLFWDRNLGYGLANLKTESNEPQIQACAPCHSRRGMIAEGFHAGDAFCDFYDPTPLRENLYHDDGQILDEVYVFGSFTQSKMYHKGIRCSDCHDPHSLQLKAPGNQVCTSCHQHPAGKYDTPSHHKHEPGKPGAACVDCHMPERTYMAVDPRRDHSLRIPRPDLSLSLGTPNACTGCHLNGDAVAEEKRARLKEYADWQMMAAEGDPQVIAEIDRANRWCEEACQKWYGDQRKTESHFAEAFTAFRSGEADGANRLAFIARDVVGVPSIARASALDDLSNRMDVETLTVAIPTAKKLLEDPSPAVRAAAIRTLAGEAYAQDGGSKLASELGEKLDDPSRLVRSTAARTLATTRTHTLLSGGRRARFNQVIDELRDGLDAVDDRGGAHMEWALICESLGRVGDAVKAYQMAIQVEPRMVGPRSNLATLLDNMVQAELAAGKGDAEQLAKTHATITNLRSQELLLLERDAALVPKNGPLQYRLGLAYYLNGRMTEALATLQRAVDLEPSNEDFQTALKLLREKLAESEN
jgi:tetratricopeptide (TPR) repeat protein